MQGSVKTIRDGVHRLRYDTGISIDGKRVQKCETFFGRRDAAEKRLRDILKAYDDGMGVEPTKMTLGQWLLEWLESAKARLRSASYTPYKGIIDQTGCSVDVNDDGTVAVASADSEAVKRAIQIIEGLTAEPEVGRVYKGTIKRLVDFGAFVEILPNNEALLHVSEIAHERVENPADLLKEGDEIEVKVISVERDGKVRLTRRELVPFPEGPEGEAAKERIARAREQGGGPPRGGGRDRDRGGRGDRDRGPRRDRR